MDSGSSSNGQRTPGSNNPRNKSHVRRESSGHLCTACDQCYRCKVRCSGDRPNCERCRSNGSACTYSTGKPLGKPKGSKNKVQRTKTSPDLSRSAGMVQADNPRAVTPHSSPTKRPSDGSLPAPKRTMSHGSRVQNTQSPSVPPFVAPRIHTPEMPSLVVPPRLEEVPLVSETLPYYVDSANHDNGLQQVMEHPTPGKIENIFPSAGLNLEMDDFQWFSATPTGIGIELATTQQESLSGVSSSVQPSGPPSNLVDQQNDALDCSMSPPVYNSTHHNLPCLCDPMSLGIISELHTLQISFSPLDTALLLARRGLSTVSSYLSCPSCANHLGHSPSLFLACVLILQQVFACYITLRMQGTKMLTSNSHKNEYSSVCIGEFEVEGEESCNVLLDAIVRAEMERGKGVIGGLEQWAEKVGDGKEKMAGMLLQSLREEIGGV